MLHHKFASIKVEQTLKKVVFQCPGNSAKLQQICCKSCTNLP